MQNYFIYQLIEAQNYLKAGGKIDYLIVVVTRPEGAPEIITNISHIPEKIEYYLNAYDEEARLKTFTDIHISGILWG